MMQIRRLLPLCFLAFIGLLLSSCAPLTNALYPTPTRALSAREAISVVLDRFAPEHRALMARHMRATWMHPGYWHVTYGEVLTSKAAWEVHENPQRVFPSNVAAWELEGRLLRTPVMP